MKNTAMKNTVIKDAINPSHYQGATMQCIEIVRHLPFSIGNCVKYAYRLGEKDDFLQEIKKIAWYANDFRKWGNFKELDACKQKAYFDEKMNYTINDFKRKYANGGYANTQIATPAFFDLKIQILELLKVSDFDSLEKLEQLIADFTV